MKKIAFTLLLLAGSIASMHAQAKFEHAQTRIQEGMSEFFVRPMVAELQMINKDCQEWSFNIFPGVSLSEISTAMLENAKANAAFKAAKLAGADIILGATFYVINNAVQNQTCIAFLLFFYIFIDICSLFDKITYHCVIPNINCCL